MAENFMAGVFLLCVLALVLGGIVVALWVLCTCATEFVNYIRGK